MEFNKVRTGIEKKFFTQCSEVVIENGYVLYDLEYISGSSTLRLYIMDEKTKTAVIEDCVKVDRALTPVFEEEWVPDDIVLEVSSPGVYRSLKTLDHFELALNENISVVISGNLDEEILKDAPRAVKNGKDFKGILKEVTEEYIILDINGFELKLTVAQLKRASLEPAL